MLKSYPFANSLAILTAAFVALLYVLKLFSPAFFAYFFDAQFLGANVSSLFPGEISFGDFLGTLLVLVVTVWVFGYVWAALYNRLAK